MNTMHPAVALILLAGICCLLLLGPAQAEAAPLISCPIFGCPGGPDNCMSATVMIRGIALTFTCYIKAVQMPS